MTAVPGVVGLRLELPSPGTRYVGVRWRFQVPQQRVPLTSRRILFAFAHLESETGEHPTHQALECQLDTDGRASLVDDSGRGYPLPGKVVHGPGMWPHMAVAEYAGRAEIGMRRWEGGPREGDRFKRYSGGVDGYVGINKLVGWAPRSFSGAEQVLVEFIRKGPRRIERPSTAWSWRQYRVAGDPHKAAWSRELGPGWYFEWELAAQWSENGRRRRHHCAVRVGDWGAYLYRFEPLSFVSEMWGVGVLGWQGTEFEFLPEGAVQWERARTAVCHYSAPGVNPTGDVERKYGGAYGFTWEGANGERLPNGVAFRSGERVEAFPWVGAGERIGLVRG